jgi:hypothetical protein
VLNEDLSESWEMQRLFRFHKHVRQPKALTDRSMTEFALCLGILTYACDSVEQHEAGHGLFYGRRPSEEAE